MKEHFEDPLTALYRKKAEGRDRFDAAKRGFIENTLVLDEFLAECFSCGRCPHCGSEVGELDAIRFDGFSAESHRRTFYREAATRDTSISPATALSYSRWKVAQENALYAIGQAADRGKTAPESDREEEPEDGKTADTVETA